VLHDFAHRLMLEILASPSIKGERYTRTILDSAMSEPKLMLN